MDNTEPCKFFNFRNLVMTQLGIVVFCVAIFSNHVLHIIGMRTDKEMFWIHARWIVAFMQYVKTFWNASTKHLVSRSMRKFTFPIKEESPISLLL